MGGDSLWQRLYAFGHRRREAWYRRRGRYLPRPVISIGNLHWGGSGKTPITAALARQLVANGQRVVVLSRGYGREDRQIRVVSTGEGPILGPKIAGDEPVLLAGEAIGAAVVVGPDRVEAGLHAMQRIEPTPDLFLLDDGFSHLRLKRDIDVLVFPADDTLAGGKLWPGGRLREPLASAARADVAVLNSTDESALGELSRALSQAGFRGPVFGATRNLGAPRLPSGEPVEPGTPALAVSAIARPEPFEAHLETHLDLRHALRFPDHHGYPASTLDSILAAMSESGAQVVVTTSKDRVKLLGRLDAPLAEVSLTAEIDPGFFGWVSERLEEITP